MVKDRHSFHFHCGQIKVAYQSNMVLQAKAVCDKTIYRSEMTLTHTWGFKKDHAYSFPDGNETKKVLW